MNALLIIAIILFSLAILVPISIYVMSKLGFVAISSNNTIKRPFWILIALASLVLSINRLMRVINPPHHYNSPPINYYDTSNAAMQHNQYMRRLRQQQEASRRRAHDAYLRNAYLHTHYRGIY